MAELLWVPWDKSKRDSQFVKGTICGGGPRETKRNLLIPEEHLETSTNRYSRNMG